jgi:predicted 3-demethylubiquinone-9 3-methyltransferase (glyoxalase superfamily)
MTIYQKITPNLWFDNQAEEAVRFYTSVFKNSGIEKIIRYGKEGYEIHKMPEGTIMTIEFFIEGQQFIALNGGPNFPFNEAVSFIVYCETQAEIDYYWEKLGEDGDEEAKVCGWLKDKYGISWQIIPVVLNELLQNADAEKSGRVMKALLQMKKLDIATLQRAFNG